MQRHARHPKPSRSRHDGAINVLNSLPGCGLTSCPVRPHRDSPADRGLRGSRGISCHLPSGMIATPRAPGSVPLFLPGSLEMNHIGTVWVAMQSRSFFSCSQTVGRDAPQSPRLFLGGCEQYLVIDWACLHPEAMILFSIVTASMSTTRTLQVAILQITKTGTGNCCVRGTIHCSYSHEDISYTTRPPPLFPVPKETPGPQKNSRTRCHQTLRAHERKKEK